MLQAAIAVVRNGPDQVKNFDDPSTGQPFVYVEQPSGFELQSTLTNDGKPVTLTVGPGAK